MTRAVCLIIHCHGKPTPWAGDQANRECRENPHDPSLTSLEGGRHTRCSGNDVVNARIALFVRSSDIEAGLAIQEFSPESITFKPC